MTPFQKDNVCGSSEWRAANNKPLKRAKLDETGLEIAGCRHGFAHSVCRERVPGRALWICTLQNAACLSVSFIWVDVICKYWKWAKNAGLLKECLIKPALSVMHAKGT